MEKLTNKNSEENYPLEEIDLTKNTPLIRQGDFYSVPPPQLNDLFRKMVNDFSGGENGSK